MTQSAAPLERRANPSRLRRPMSRLGGLGAPDRRAVDDQYRHRPISDGNRQAGSQPSIRAGLRGLCRITVDRDGAGGPLCRTSRKKLLQDGRGPLAARRRPSTTSATRCLADHPACRRGRSTNTASIRAMSVSAKKERHASFPPSSKWRSNTTSQVRIGANWGSLDQELLTKLMDENTRFAETRRDARRDPRAKGDGAVRAHLGRHAPKKIRPAARQDHPVGEGPRPCRTWIAGLSGAWPAAPITPFTWASPKPAWGFEGHRGRHRPRLGILDAAGQSATRSSISFDAGAGAAIRTLEVKVRAGNPADDGFCSRVRAAGSRACPRPAGPHHLDHVFQGNSRATSQSFIQHLDACGWKTQYPGRGVAQCRP